MCKYDTFLFSHNKGVDISEILKINSQISSSEVRVVGPEGQQIGIKSLKDALDIASAAELDLVEVAPNSQPPVCKIMDFGKYKYQLIQKKKEAKRKTVNVSVKEMKFRPKIDNHDYQTKLKHLKKFIDQGSKIKCTIMFRGREMAHPEFGRQILDRIIDDLYEVTEIELAPQQEGRNMLMILVPLKKGKKKPSKDKLLANKENVVQEVSENTDVQNIENENLDNTNKVEETNE